MESKAHYDEDGSDDEQQLFDQETDISSQGSLTMIPLAPSGISPWDHKAVVFKDGHLMLTWRMANGGTRIRTFTQEETSTLLDILYEARNDIHRVDLGSGKSGVCPICLETLDAADMCPNRDRQDHIPVIRDEFLKFVDGQL